MNAYIPFGNHVKRLANYVHDDAFSATLYGDSVIDLDVSRTIISNNQHSKLVTITALVWLPKDFKVALDKSHFLIPLYDTALHIWLERKTTRTHINFSDTRVNLKIKLVMLC